MSSKAQSVAAASFVEEPASMHDGASTSAPTSHDLTDSTSRMAPGIAAERDTAVAGEEDDDDVRMAVSALGIMRCGSFDSAPSPAASVSGGAGHSGRRSRPFVDVSRSASTASAASSTVSSADTRPTTNTTDSTASTSPSRQSASKSSHKLIDDDDVVLQQDEAEESAAVVQDPNFIARASQFPIVSGALNAYERSKASSRVVKYGAGLVESSLSTMTRPLTHASTPASAKEPATLSNFVAASDPADADVDSDPTSASTPRRPASGVVAPDSNAAAAAGRAVAVNSRSRWQTVLLEAGGLGAAVSEESLKSLKYCLHWLLYATAHLDHQIVILRNFIASSRYHRGGPVAAGSAANGEALVSAHLAQIKHDVVDTIRRVVDVVSKYAGAALPEPAKRYVRQSILSLPGKWTTAVESRRHSRAASTATSGASTPRMPERMEDLANAAAAAAAASGSGEHPRRPGASRSSSSTSLALMHHRSSVAALHPQHHSSSSSSLSTYHPAGRHQLDPAGGTPIFEDNNAAGADDDSDARSTTEDAAERVLTFAVESLDMLRSVTQIFGDSVEKAEAWIERLRIVGLDRQRRREAGEPSPPPRVASSAETSALASTSATGVKRRRQGGASGNGAAASSSSVAALTAAGEPVEVADGTDTDMQDEDAIMVRRKRPQTARSDAMDENSS